MLKGNIFLATGICEQIVKGTPNLFVYECRFANALIGPCISYLFGELFALLEMK